MSNIKSAATLQDQLNRCMPIAHDTKLGDLIAALIVAVNAVTAACLTKAGLAIKASTSPTVKAANAILANIGGVYVSKAANTDMAALVGSLATAKSAAWAFYIDASGTLSTSDKTADAADHAAAVALIPAVPAGQAQIGVLVLDNATGAAFVGGTTALDTASLTATYYDTVGPVPTAAHQGDLASRS